MRRILLASGLSLVLTTGLGSAEASGPQVLLDYDYELVPFDSGYQLVVICGATADPEGFEDVAIATVVDCTVDGIRRNQAMPGREALIAVNTTVPAGRSVEICLSWQAAFINVASNDVAVPTAGPQCETLSA
jgi:hypothetical protein